MHLVNRNLVLLHVHTEHTTAIRGCVRSDSIIWPVLNSETVRVKTRIAEFWYQFKVSTPTSRMHVCSHRLQNRNCKIEAEIHYFTWVMMHLHI